MNKIEITRKNIEDFGYIIGSHKGSKGTEIFESERYFGSWWHLSDAENDNKRKAIARLGKVENLDDLYVREIRVIDPDKMRSYNFGSDEKEAERFTVRMLIDRQFKDVDYVEIYYKKKIAGFMSISKYDSSYESQTQLIIDIKEKFDNCSIVGQGSDYSYDEPDELITFNSKGASDSHSDYHLEHGPQMSTLYPRESEDVSGRLSNYNESIVDDFWEFTMKEMDTFEYLDKEEDVSVFHRKGKDWYVKRGVEQVESCISYRNSSGEYIEDGELYFFVENNVSQDKIDRIIKSLEEMVFDVEVNGYICNELEIGNYSYGGYDYNDGILDFPIIDREFSDEKWELKSEIIEHVDVIDCSGTEVKHAVKKAIENFLMSNIDDDNILFKKYSHLQKLKELAEKDGKKLDYLRIGNFTEDKLMCISYRGEHQHFYLEELYRTSPAKLYKSLSGGLTKKITESYSSEILMNNARKVFVSVEDSTSSGNCDAGTMQFCSRYGIDTNKIGGIRGDELLKLDFSSFTRRAVMQSIKRLKVAI